MSRLEIDREGAVDYSVPLPRALLRDARLSFGARGLFAFLWDLPRGWILRLAHLIWMGPEGRDALRARLRELERVGAIRIEPLRDTETGRLAGKRWILVAADRWAVAAPLSTEERVFRSSAGPNIGEPAARGYQGVKDLQTTTTDHQAEGVVVGDEDDLVEAALWAAQGITRPGAYANAIRRRLRKAGPSPDDLTTLAAWRRAKARAVATPTQSLPPADPAIARAALANIRQIIRR